MEGHALVDDRRANRLLAAGIGVLALIAIVMLLFHLPLSPTLGISVVAFALYLPPRHTLILAIVAVLTAMAVLAILPMADKQIRFTNSALAAALAVSVSWAIDQRLKRISSFQRTQTSLFASVPDGLAVIDSAGILLECNEGLTVLAPQAEVGQSLHDGLGHVLSDGTECPGGCRLDGAGESASLPVLGEAITRKGQRVPIGYTVAKVDAGTILSLRDVSAIEQAAENQRAVLESAVRQGEQESLLRTMGAPAFTELPAFEGLTFDLYSTHTTSGWAGGGDLVHVTGMLDGRVLVSVVDALEQGVISLRDAWKVHYTSQSYVMSGTSLVDVIPRTVGALETEQPMPNASLMLTVIDPVTGMFDLVGGGHPPALLVRENGASEWLDGEGPGIGFGAGVSETVYSRQLLAGDSLLFYTDGLIDGSGVVIEALSTLRASATALRKRTAQGYARSLTEAVMGTTQNSGSATLLLVRLSPDSGSRQTSASL